MKKKKIQIEELKVKSFLTVVNKEEQRTTKGGYVDYPRAAAAQAKATDAAGQTYWTSEKTRLAGPGGVLISFGGDTRSSD